MLDINFIRENPKKVKKGCAKKQIKVDIDKLLDFDEKRRSLLQKVEKLRAKQNKASQKKPTQEEIAQLKKTKQKIKKLEDKLDKVNKKYKKLLYLVPNLPFDNVPEGKDDKENVVLRKIGKRTKKKDPYYEIAKKLDIIDTKRAAKVSGSRFGYLKREAVLLEMALVNFAFDKLSEKGFIPVIPPIMIKKKPMRAMGYWDRGKEEIYYLKKDGLCLIGTSEQALGAMHMDEILDKKDLPLRYAGFSPCFRREAGSYGKDTRGIFRVHQFDKVEMFSFCKPEYARKEHEFLLEIEEELMQALELPYQVVQICTGDLGDPAANKYDIEAWFPSQKKYRETHSCSNCTDWQARRLNTRYKDKKELKYVYTLNGTAFSMRPMLAILENFQQKDGSILIPKALQKYTGFKRIKPR